MKKKFLSLMMAAAMVASTSVSAFATTQNIDVQPNKESVVNIPMQGNIESKDGQIAAGTIAVTVPTSASFKVDTNGVVSSGKMNIVNKGEKKISVLASSFKDTTGPKSINLVKTLDPNDRKQVSLRLTGGDEEIILTSDGGGKMYKVSAPDQAISEDFKLQEVNPHEQLELQLKGEGTAYNASAINDGGSVRSNGDDPVSDEFKLVLKIKQVNG